LPICKEIAYSLNSQLNQAQFFIVFLLMKKIIFSVILTAATFLLSAQSQRLVLFEEFTQASCAPCAVVNPPLNHMLNKYHDKVVSIKYQTYFPGIDPMNQDNPIDVDDRFDYYNLLGVPSGKLDGGIAFSGTPDQMDSTHILNRYAMTSPFNINVNYNLSPNNDTIYCSASIQATQGVSGNLVAHMVVIERDIYFSYTPGTNDEKHFEGVMKKMLPSSAGTALQSSWASGDSLTLSYSWKLGHIYDLNQLACVVFIQDTTTKEVLQAGYRPPDISEDIAVTSATNIPSLQCTSTLSPQVTIHNKGYNMVTNVDIVCYVNGIQLQVFPWTGNLLPYDEIDFSYPQISPGDGGFVITFKAMSPNGLVDVIPLNDSSNVSAVIETNSILLPFDEDFTSLSLPATIAVLDPAVDENHWQYSSVGYGNLGSVEMPVFGSEEFGAHDYFFLPKFDFTNAGPVIDLTFDVAYAPYSSALSDDLTISVSTDCGVNWATVFNKGGTALATAPATTSAFVPTPAQWRAETVSLNSVSGMNDVLILFDLYGRRGNNIYIDNLYVTGNQVGVLESPAESNIQVYPLPAEDILFISNSNDFEAAIIYTSTGQEIKHLLINENEHNFGIEISDLDEGIYFMRLFNDQGSALRKFIISRK
jgi:hypothetical protein